MGKYDDIINLPHHVSDYHKPMTMNNRAAQFAPFAALTGHDDAIAETQRLTESFKELTDDEKVLISQKLIDAIVNSSNIKLTYFEPDKHKKGGSYLNLYGQIKKWDETDNLLIMKDGFSLPVYFIKDVNILDDE